MEIGVFGKKIFGTAAQLDLNEGQKFSKFLEESGELDVKALFMRCGNLK